MIRHRRLWFTCALPGSTRRRLQESAILRGADHLVVRLHRHLAALAHEFPPMKELVRGDTEALPPGFAREACLIGGYTKIRLNLSNIIRIG